VTDLVSGLVVVHDLGAEGGAPWVDAFAAWDGRVDAPDLPGHGAAPAPRGGNHEVGDSVFALVEHLSGDFAVPPVVVGVGLSGIAATTFALGGRASALVLVDGLGGPWLDVPGRNARIRAARRAILATPAALRPHEPGTTDPRAGLTVTADDRSHVQRVLAAVPVPVLVVETPASTTPDAVEVAGVIPDHVVVRVVDPAPPTVAGHVIEWLTTRSPGRPG
jgi:hypothetical protein